MRMRRIRESSSYILYSGPYLETFDWGGGGGGGNSGPRGRRPWRGGGCGSAEAKTTSTL